MGQNENREVLCRVYEALREKGYHPLSQIVGYLLTEAPTYITNHNGARQLIRLRDMVEDYLEQKERGGQRQ